VANAKLSNAIGKARAQGHTVLEHPVAKYGKSKGAVVLWGGGKKSAASMHSRTMGQVGGPLGGKQKRHPAGSPKGGRFA